MTVPTAIATPSLAERPARRSQIQSLHGQRFSFQVYPSRF
jgi:hypothetical protein